ncbi:MAG: hypothetical protein HYZ73_07765, partial [Elusimicrobia bacterium]|nr:hypothetical protein [Elusimicrobiota bacterium]
MSASIMLLLLSLVWLPRSCAAQEGQTEFPSLTDYEWMFAVPMVNGGTTVLETVPVIRGPSVLLELRFFFGIALQPYSPPSISFRYLFDGQPLGPVFTGAGSFPFTLDTTSDPRRFYDGTHALSVELFDGPPQLYKFRPRPVQVVINNSGPPVTSRQRIPVVGHHFGSHHDSPALDWIEFPGLPPPRAPAHPLYDAGHPYVVSAPPRTPEEADGLRSPRSWFVEPLTHAISHLYYGVPTFYSTREGHVITDFYYPDIAATSEDARLDSDQPRVERHDTVVDGERDDNSVNPYSTYVSNPNEPGAWMAVDISGRLFCVEADGAVETIAGYKLKRNVLPYHPKDRTLPIHDRAKYDLVGDFRGPAFNMPVDLAFDPRDAKILYVADTENARMAKVDLRPNPPIITTYAGVAGSEGYRDGPANQALFHEPYSVVVMANGTLYVADEENCAIRTIAPNGGAVSTLVGGTCPPEGKQRIVDQVTQELVGGRRDTANRLAPVDVSFAQASINWPQVIRADSEGNLILGEHVTQTVRRINLATGRVQRLTYLVGNPNQWIWLDVDKHGNIGPKDDILASMATGGVGNISFWRIP